MIETRLARLECRVGEEESPGIVAGLVLPLNELSERNRLPFRERWAAGSINLAAQVRANWQHLRHRPLAVWPDAGLELELAAAGLRASISLPLRSTAATSPRWHGGGCCAGSRLNSGTPSIRGKKRAASGCAPSIRRWLSGWRS